jgi:hypothetical protein
MIYTLLLSTLKLRLGRATRMISTSDIDMMLRTTNYFDEYWNRSVAFLMLVMSCLFDPSLLPKVNDGESDSAGAHSSSLCTNAMRCSSLRGSRKLQNIAKLAGSKAFGSDLRRFNARGRLNVDGRAISEHARHRELVLFLLLVPRLESMRLMHGEEDCVEQPRIAFLGVQVLDLACQRDDLSRKQPSR